ncbi:MAG TPA: ATP-binding protein [Natronincola sp.]|nr:ATP-binding protein [Natronincola sp.]
MHISKSSDKELNKIMHLSSRDNIMIHSLDTTSLPLLATAKQILKSFAKKINVLSMQSISPSKTMEMLKNEKSKEAKQILKIIQAADLDIDDFYYDRNLVSHDIFDYDKNDMKDKNFRSLNQWLDVLRLVSVKKGKSLPSIIYDSLGTRKIVALSGYLIECLNRGGSLFIDELDSGLHFKLSRSILSLFNNSVNTQAQLIFTTHDASLLDIRTLFRKEQIWFTDRVDEQLFLYSLSAFTAENSGIRLDSSLYDHYSKGLFGALPDPTLIDVLLTNQVGEVDE